MQVDFAGEEFEGRPEEETVMYNLVGHELAQLIEECNGLARAKMRTSCMTTLRAQFW